MPKHKNTDQLLSSDPSGIGLYCPITAGIPSFPSIPALLRKLAILGLCQLSHQETEPAAVLSHLECGA